MRDKQIHVGVPSVNAGKGGSGTYYDNQNTLGGPNYLVRTTRTGVGVGESFSGTLLLYPIGSGNPYETVPNSNLLVETSGGVLVMNTNNIISGFTPDTHPPQGTTVLGHLEGVNNEFGLVEDSIVPLIFL